MPKQIILVRHGETDNNKNKKLMNWDHDIGRLTKQGRIEAGIVGQRLAGIKIDAMYVSDLLRTVETAQEIVKYVQITPTFTTSIRERNLGIFGDHTFDEIKQKWPEKFAKFIDHSDLDWNGLEGESLSDVHKRIKSFLSHLEAKHSDQTVLLVTHSGVLYTSLRDVFGFFPRDSWMDVEHTSITILRKQNNSYLLEQFNKTD